MVVTDRVGADPESPVPPAGARSALSEREQWMLAAVESAVEGIATIDAAGTIEYVNRSLEQLFGYTADEIIGRNVSMLMPSPYRDDHDAYLHRYIETGERRIIGIGRDVVGMRKDGSIFPMHLAVSEAQVGDRRLFTGFIYDITQRKKQEQLQDELLQELNKRNSEIDCLYRIGEALRSGEQSDETFDRVARILQSALRHPAIGSVCVELDDRAYDTDINRRTPWAVVGDVVASGRRRGEVRAYLTHEEPLHGDTLHNERSLVEGVAALLSEAIERGEAEAKVIQASKLASVGELAAGVGHEINNPVNGIINCADIILKEAKSGSTIAKFAELIRSEADRIAVIVHNLLTFSRQDKRQYSLARLSDVVETVASLCRKKLDKSHIRFEVDVPESLPRLYCRSEQLQQVVMNLVINGMHALDEKYPEDNPDKLLSIRATPHEKDGLPFVRLTVEDRGTGISDAHRQRMFDPFFTTKGRDKGTGLGLSISDGIVRAHGGTIECETHPGRFTRFHVDLPLRPEGTTAESPVESKVRAGEK